MSKLPNLAGVVRDQELVTGLLAAVRDGREPERFLGHRVGLVVLVVARDVVCRNVAVDLDGKRGGEGVCYGG